MTRNIVKYISLFSLLFAIATAILLRQLEVDSQHGWLANLLACCNILAKVFLQALKMLIIPIIVTSIISAMIGQHVTNNLKKIGVKTTAFYLSSTAIAAMVGLFFVNIITPGKLSSGEPNQHLYEMFTSNQQETAQQKIANTEPTNSDSWQHFFLSLFPENIVLAATKHNQLLSVLIFCLLFGLASQKLPTAQRDIVREWFSAVHHVIIIMTNWVMKFIPVAVFAMVFPAVMAMGASVISAMLPYMATVVIALIVHAVVILPTAVWLLAARNPWQFLKSIRPALITAFSTSSSSATLPLTMNCVEQAGVSKRVSRFSLPLGATINMDGTALYECVAVLFVAQVMGLDLSVSMQFIVVITALLTSIGVAGIPNASMVAILLIMKNTNIPYAEAAAISLLSVDRILDMCRTTVNVWSDACVAAMVQGKNK